MELRNPIQSAVEKRRLVDAYRQGVHKVTFGIANEGTVDDEDLEKLYNFMQISLALMELVSLETIEQAQRNAEIMSLHHFGG